MQRYVSLSIELPAEHRAWLSDRLAALGFSAFEEQSRAQRLRVIIYDESEARLRDVELRLRERARSELPALRLRFAYAPVRGGWELAWTEHLEPVQLTPALRLCPGVPGAAPAAGTLYLAPAFAFGFGEHPSTRLIASWLEQWCRRRPGGAVLDVGSGTGVLALVACRSGAGRVLGIDTSLHAVQAAEANAALNQIRCARFQRTTADQVGERFECVVANIEARVLLEIAPSLVRCVAPGGELALAGFLEEQAGELLHRYGAAGLGLHVVAREGDWCLLAGRALPEPPGRVTRTRPT